MSDSLAFWAFSDAHVGTDRRFGRDSLSDAIRQAESAFAWDFALDLGDMSGGQSVPVDEEGEEVVRQFAALRDHRREDIFSVAGAKPFRLRPATQPGASPRLPFWQ